MEGAGAAEAERAELRRHHLGIGWTAIALFATAGLLLEALHGLKVGAYLDVGQETRRLVWTLGHAHGTLLGVIHVVFGLSAPDLGPGLQLPSRALTAALFLLPTGFFLGGVGARGGDPGIGIALVPPGAVLLVVAVAVIAVRAIRR